MPSKDQVTLLPDYHGADGVPRGLPRTVDTWLLGRGHRVTAKRVDRSRARLRKVVQRAVSHGPWKWPKRPVFFFGDPHADAQAFIGSLIATGGVIKSGPAVDDIALNRVGRRALFVIGGDCLDKGPSNLRLLRAIRRLIDTGARVKLIAGNHDVRLLMGLRALSEDADARTEHFFVRMGPKVVPLLLEVGKEYLAGRHALRDIPSARECRRRLFPSAAWFDDFAVLAAQSLPDVAVRRELARMQNKTETLEHAWKDAGLSVRQVYAIACKCRDLFLRPDGEFAWFFRDMQLLHRDGSFLFVHAGIDDSLVRLIDKKGIGHLNRTFREQLKNDLFGFYYGPLGNAMRTKYRDFDRPLSKDGVKHAYRLGLYAVVHGHRNRSYGQRIMLRRGMIHFECDTTMDRNSRKKKGMRGFGSGVTIVQPAGCVLGISNDYPSAKSFVPSDYLQDMAKGRHAA